MIKAKYERLSTWLDEKRRRLWAAVEAEQLGFGGVSAVAAATGLSRNTIRAGVKELAAARRARRPPRAEGGERIRRPGGGRERLTEKDPRLPAGLDALVQPYTRGDPMSPLRWTQRHWAWIRGQHFDLPALGRTFEATLFALEQAVCDVSRRHEGSRGTASGAQNGRPNS